MRAVRHRSTRVVTRLLPLLLACSCATVRPPPDGLRTAPDAVAKAEQQVKQAAKVREVAATISGVIAGAGGVVLLGSQLQPIQTAPGSSDPSLAGIPTTAERLQQLSADNKSRDRTIAAGLALGSVGVFLGACVASAVMEDGASEWLAEQRAKETRDLTPVEADANRALLDAARLAARAAPTPGWTLRPGQRRARQHVEAPPLVR